MIVVMQIWEGDKNLAVGTAKRLKELYPDVLLGVLANNMCEHPKEMENYADLIHTTTEDVFAAGTGGLAAHELLCLALEMPGQIIVKIDADTKIHPVQGVTDEMFNKRAGVFGKMQQTIGEYGIALKSVNGGALGISRNAARLFVDEKILLDENLISLNKNNIPAYIRQKLEARMHGKLLSSHDWTIAWACEQLKIPMEYDSLLISIFEHEARKKIALAPNKNIISMMTKSSRSLTKNGQLRDEHLINERIRDKNISSFFSFIWGDNGIVVSKKDLETKHIINKEFINTEDALSYVTFRDGQHMTIMARPSCGKVQMLVLDLDESYDNSVDVSTVRTSEKRYHVFMRMEPALTEAEAREILEMATFADVVGSGEATFVYGCRVPSTPSYSKDCMPLHDGCVAVDKLRGEVEFIKKVDKFYSKEEALDVISQLSKACKAPLLETREELVLL